MLVVAAFTGFNAWAFFAYSQSRAELESDHAAKSVRLEALYRDAARTQEQIKQKNIPALNARASFTNGLLERRRFSWTDLLNSLEEVQPYQVRLQSLMPRIQEKGILIESRGVAKDLKAFWNLQQNLQNHPKFRRVYPGGFLHNSDAGEYIFNLSFNYFPQGAPMDVQGLTPELAGITQAPGEGPNAGPTDLEEEAVTDPFPPKVKEPRAKTPPARADAGPTNKKPPPGPPTAKATAPPGVNAPGGPGEKAPIPPNPNAQAEQDAGGGRGPSTFRPLPSDLNTAVVGGAQPGEGDASLGTANAGRWHGRGAIPGQAGKRPQPTKKPEGLPTIKLPEKPDPDSDDDEQKKKEGGEGDDR